MKTTNIGLRLSKTKPNLTKTSVSDTIRMPPLVKAQTALKQKINKIWQKKFQYGTWNSYTLQCGTVMTLISR